MIGILLALQVNTWNQNRQIEDTIHQHRLDLVDQLQADLNQLDYIDRVRMEYSESIKSFLNYYSTPDLNIDTLFMKWRKVNIVINSFNSNTYSIEEIITNGTISYFTKEEKEKIMALKHRMEIDPYNERSEINYWDKFRFLKNSNIDRASDFKLTLGQHALVKGWREDFNSEQFLLVTNYLAETLRLYREQDKYTARIRGLIQELKELLERNMEGYN